MTHKVITKKTPAKKTPKKVKRTTAAPRVPKAGKSVSGGY